MRRNIPGSITPYGRAVGRLLTLAIVFLLSVGSLGSAARPANVSAGTFGNERSFESAVIGLNTIDQLAELATFAGPGAAHSHALSPDGELLAISGPKGSQWVIDVRRVADGVLLHRLEGHPELTWSLAFSPDGSRLVSGSEDGTVRLWRLTDGTLEHTLESGTPGVRHVLFSPDGLLVAAGTRDGNVMIWRADTGELVRTIDVSPYGWVDAVAFSPDGRSIAAGESRAPRLWALDSSAPPRTFAEAQPMMTVESVTFSPDGRWLTGSTTPGPVVVWRTEDGSVAQVLEGHEWGSGSTLFTSAGDVLISDAEDGTVRFWRVGDWAPLRTIRIDYNDLDKDPVLSADGRTLAFRTANGEVTVWRPLAWSLRHTLAPSTGIATGLRYSHDGTFFITGSKDHRVRIWRASDGALPRTLEGHQDIVLDLDVSPDDGLIASSSLDGTVRLWRVVDGELLSTLDGFKGDTQAVTFSPDGSLLAAGSEEGELRVIRVADVSVAYRLEGRDEVSAIAFSPDGRLVAIPGSGDTIRLLNAADGSELTVLHGQPDRVHSLDFSPDGQLLAAGGMGGAVRAWRVADTTLIRTFVDKRDFIYGVRFSPDGQLLAAVGTESISGYTYVWRVDDGAVVWGTERLPDTVFGVDFSPDGATLATSSDDGAIRLWQVASGALLGSIGSPIAEAAVSPDGQRVTALDVDWQVRSWSSVNGAGRGSFLVPMDDRTRFMGVMRGVALAPEATWLVKAAAQWPTAPLEVWSVDEQRPLRELGAVDSSAALAIPPGSACVLAMEWQTVRLVCPPEGDSRVVDLGGAVTVSGDGPRGFSPDGSRFAVTTGYSDEELFVASLTERQLLWSVRGADAGFREVTALAFSPDDQTLAVGVTTTDYESALQFFQVSNGAPLRMLRDESGDVFASIVSLKFSPDGTLLAISRRDGQVELRRQSDWTIIRTLVGHTRPVKQVFFAGAESIVTSSEDGAILVWTR